MADHYNAFISYRHAEADIRVAEAIEKGLEQFHVPGKNRQKTGIKRINRIFRDKDELPLTSDLTAEISNALENSDYLIVICSTNTRESLWVPREIEFFLRMTENWIRDVLYVKTTGKKNVSMFTAEWDILKKQALELDYEYFAAVLKGIDELRERLKYNVSTEISLNDFLLKL